MKSSLHPKSSKGSLPSNRLYSARSPSDSSDSEDVENRIRSSNTVRPSSANIGQSYYSKPPITNTHRSTRRQEDDGSSDENIEFLSRELNKKSSRGAPMKTAPVPPSVDSEDKWKSRYHRTQEQLDDALQKIKELQQSNSQLSKELKEARDSVEIAKETNKKTLERLKTKMAMLESSLMQNQKEGYGELEKENKRLQAEITKMKIELDRAKDADNLIPHYRLAIMKVRAQSTAMKEKLDQYTQEKKATKQEMEMVQRALQEAENKNQALLLQIQEMQEAREQEIHDADQIKHKLQHELHELREARSVTDQSEITRLRNEISSLEDTVYQQKQIISQLEATIAQQREDYNLHLQAALDLATAIEPPKPAPVQTYNYTSDTMLPKYPLPPSSSKSKKPKQQPFSSRDVMSDTPTASRPRASSFSPMYQSDSGRGIDTNLTSPGNPGSALKKNLETLDEEIQQLAKSLEKASEKLRL